MYHLLILSVSLALCLIYAQRATAAERGAVVFVKTPFGKKIFGFETKKHMADGHVSFKQLLLLYFTVTAISLSVTEVIVRAFLLPSVIYINFSVLLSGL